jgi:predicted pyridoxine 5'-phosphate oxidase superfamily flavin-nucleotide-binding protein
MASPFHEGERAVQARVGVLDEAAQVGRIVDGSIAPAIRVFIRRQRLAVLAGLDAAGNVWASPLTGSPGFISALDPHTIQIEAPLPPFDPLAESVRDSAPVGLLIIDLANRGRVRLNGRASAGPNGALLVQIEEAFGNCQRYIQSRVAETDADTNADTSVEVAVGADRSTSLSDAQRQWVTSADTFFIATAHPERGADASHRGGPPGFVQVLDERHLRFPDYAGNNMFQTLGNLAVDPRAGLLFVDFESGRTLQLSGQARVIWDGPDVQQVAGAERLVEFELKAVVDSAGPRLPHWRFIGYSPFLPAGPGR